MTDKNKKKSLTRAFALAAALTLAPLAGATAAHAQAADDATSVTTTSVEAPAIGPATGDGTFLSAPTEAAPAEPAVAPAGKDFDFDGLMFLAPWLLLGGLSLPVLWFLMRQTPPQPGQVQFPGTRLLRELAPKEETPKSLPWWHRAMRVTAAGLVVGGLAQPLLNPDEPLGGQGPVLLVVDNGWASAGNWQARVDEMKSVIDRAESEGRGIIVLPTAAPNDNESIRASAVLSAEEARQLTANIVPQPWAVDRGAALAALANVKTGGPVTTVWLSNGLDGAATNDLAQALAARGTLRVYEDPAKDAPHMLVPPASSNGDLTVTVRRANGEAEETLTLLASDRTGKLVDRIEVKFGAGETEKAATFALPTELKADITRVAIDGDRSAGAVVLLDGQWRHRPVGLVATGAPETLQPLLSEYNFIESALRPYAELHNGSVDQLLKSDLAVMVLGDNAVLDDEARKQVDNWVREGGTLLRFAGPRLMEHEDSLLPVDLREGGRTMGGSMSWGAPQTIAAFPENSPFYGLTLPSDVTVERQVLAQPDGNLDERVWARLADGTPIVTAEKRGEGTIILVHTTANTSWSNLALSGLFVDMLRTVVEQSRGVNGVPTGTDTLPAWKTLDGSGRLVTPPAAVKGLSGDAIRQHIVGPQTPPGFYGTDAGRRAHNLAAPGSTIAPLPALPDGVERQAFVNRDQNDLSALLLSAALLLVIGDLMVNLAHNRRNRPQVTPPRTQPGRRPAP
jgi:hypothetical protein